MARTHLNSQLGRFFKYVIQCREERIAKCGNSKLHIKQLLTVQAVVHNRGTSMERHSRSARPPPSAEEWRSRVSGCIPELARGDLEKGESEEDTKHCGLRQNPKVKRYATMFPVSGIG